MDTMQVVDGAEPRISLTCESRLVDLERAEVRRYQHWNPWSTDHQTVETAWAVESRYGLNYWDALMVSAARARLARSMRMLPVSQYMMPNSGMATSERLPMVTVRRGMTLPRINKS